ncbi:MAG: EAL domain-containing protein, partial [Pseudomonas sp.]
MSQPKILISENSVLAQQAMTAILKSLGYTQLFIATNADEATNLLIQESEFDILICTITTPLVPELNLLRQLNKHGRIHSVVLVTDAPEDLKTAIKQFTQHCGYSLLGDLGKPFTKAEIQAILGSYPGMPTDTSKKSDPISIIAKDVAYAVAQEQFIPFYQPKVNLQTLEVVGAEILMRWNHPQLGILAPYAFIDIAKRFSHLATITNSVLEQAIDFANAHNFGEHFKLSINIDATQICYPSLYNEISALLERKRFRAENLIIEITECGALKSPAECLSNLIHLRLLGCEISVDDFGAGFSSLQRVCELPCTELKLDMSFVRNLRQNRRTRTAVA